MPPEAPVEIDKSYFWTEGCAIFACALANRLLSDGQPADIAVFSRSAGDSWSDDQEFEFTHVVVSVAEGYIDVNGFDTDPAAMMRRIGIDESINLQGDWSASEFSRLFMGFGDDFPLYGATPETLDQANRVMGADPQAFQLLATGDADDVFVPRSLRPPSGSL